MASNAQTICQYWKQFNLSSLQKELDDKATDLANRQDESETSRRKLVDLCKEFKKTAPEEIKKQVTPVLKCFQTEVDNLSKRSKAAESAFLSLYKKIIESPDPSPALDSLMHVQKKAHKLQDFEIENANLKDTINQYNKEFSEVKNQEITIRQLREKIRTFEEQMESLIKSKVSEKEGALQKSFETKEKRMEFNEALLKAKLAEAETRVESLEKVLNTSQQELFMLKSKSDEIGTARSAEMDMLASDIEKANLRAAMAEKEMEALKNSLKPLSEETNDVNSSSFADQSNVADFELASKDRQISQLLNEVTELKFKSDAEISTYAKKIEILNEQMSQKSQNIQKFEEKLNAQKDYDDIKRELCILKSIYLGENDSSTKTAEAKNLEMLLIEKNKGLQTEKTHLMNLKRDQENEIQRLKCECQRLTAVNGQQVQLIGHLEQDLLKVNQSTELSSENISPDVSNLDLISNAIGCDQKISPKTCGGIFLNSESSLLPVITSQRDRLKIRVEELEDINFRNSQQIGLLTTEIEHFKTDNVKLYEKIKFLHSYQAQNKGKKLEKGSTDELMQKYSVDYEASLDPFRRFGIQERQRRYMALSTHDKATLSISRLIMSSGTARAVFFFYLLLLHGLVFLVLYKLAYTESCQRDAAADCLKMHREHMSQVHGHDHPK